ncbi:hypothetical protein JOL62DRAFT_230187 [Phyllosticta paracitricarpa]|uniref:Uncharacterized protein n=1 Tax=Phyllosticta paracitricarpa TaxID=2016321 RepID=A0ABR1NHL5_9PEZI
MRCPSEARCDGAADSVATVDGFWRLDVSRHLTFCVRHARRLWKGTLDIASNGKAHGRAMVLPGAGKIGVDFTVVGARVGCNGGGSWAERAAWDQNTRMPLYSGRVEDNSCCVQVGTRDLGMAFYARLQCQRQESSELGGRTAVPGGWRTDLSVLAATVLPDWSRLTRGCSGPMTAGNKHSLDAWLCWLGPWPDANRLVGPLTPCNHNEDGRVCEGGEWQRSLEGQPGLVFSCKSLW